MKLFLKSLLVTSVLLLISKNLSAQDCKVKNTTDWKLVEIRIMEQKYPPKEYEIIGEWILEDKSSIKKLSALSKSDKKEMKKKAAKDGSCLVFIDSKGLWDTTSDLYYYWVKQKHNSK